MTILLIDNKSTRRSISGFSLVELLVVLLIIGLGFSAVRFNVADNSNYRLLLEAKQFANRTALIAEEAVLTNQQWGVDIYREFIDGQEQYGYRWLIRSDDLHWQLANLANEDVDFLLPANIGLHLSLEGLAKELIITAKREVTEEKADNVGDQSRADDAKANDARAMTDEELFQPSLWLMSSGEISAFRLTLFNVENPDNQVVISGDELGRIVVVNSEDANE